MVVLIEVAGWLVFGVAVVGVVINFALSRRDAGHRPHPATRKMVLGCMIAAGVMLALAYALAALGVADTLIDTGRRGSSLWVPAAIFALVAAGGISAWRRGPQQS
jgi:uncharacterized membrane protein YidH (DUF202 family)